MVTNYTFYEDSGHGWLKVEREWLVELNIEDRISNCSYQRDGEVYLEEDRDFWIFCETFKEFYGELPYYKKVYYDGECFVRSLDWYKP